MGLLCERIVWTGTGYVQVAACGLIGAIRSSIGIHLVQSRVGQSPWYGIAGHAMWSQMRSFFGHL